MNDFEKMIAETVANKLNDGTVERLVEQKIEEAIKKGLDDIFGYGGEAKKLIEKKLGDAMIPVIENHDFNEYLIKLDEVLTTLINQTNIVDNKRILENFKTCMSEPQQKEIKLSEIFEKYCEHVSENVSTDNLKAYCEDGEPYYEFVTANLEVEAVDKGYYSTSRFDDCYVNFSCEEDKDLNIQIKLYKSVDEDNWSILRGVGGIEIRSLRNLSNFEVFLSVLQRSYTKIVVDTKDESEWVTPSEKPEWDLR